VKALTFILGLVLAACGAVGILSETLWQNSLEVDRVLCRFFAGANEPLELRARQQLAGVSEEDLHEAIALFRELLQRDSQNPYRWADLGEAFLEARQKEEARVCYGQVLALAPHSAPFLLRVANFYFLIGENNQALPITARILTLIPDYDSIIFSEYTRLVDHPEEVLLYGLPQDRRAVKSWLQYLMQAGRLDDAQRTWDWVAQRGHDDDSTAGEYAGFLVQQGHPDTAVSVWAQHLGARAGDYRKSNYLFNGSFEFEVNPSPFDWNLGHAQGVEVARECTTAGSGNCSLRISFAGTQNLDFAAASQLALVRTGPYRFHASIRTEGLTTDQGIRFRIYDAELPARWDVIFGQFKGTMPWSPVEQDLTLPPQTKLLRVQVIRQPSMKFDNKIMGTAWIDELRLEPISHPSSP
jgi:tetratricopeptide (TPR) repeat protein